MPRPLKKHDYCVSPQYPTEVFLVREILGSSGLVEVSSESREQRLVFPPSALWKVTRIEPYTDADDALDTLLRSLGQIVTLADDGSFRPLLEMYERTLRQIKRDVDLAMRSRAAYENADVDEDDEEDAGWP